MWKIRTWLAPLFVAVISLIAGCERASSHLVLQQLNGHITQLADYRGKWVILNYWAGWCGWCIKEIPEFNHFYADYKDKNVVVFGVNFDHLPTDQLSALAYRLDMQYPLLSNDPITALGVQDIPGLPITFVIDPHGKLLPPLLGGQTEQSIAKVIGY